MAKTSADLTKTKTFIYQDNQQMSLEDAKLSLNWRIAEALETIADNSKITAQNFLHMAEKIDFYKRKIDRLEKDLIDARKSNSALRGVITRLKNQND